MSDIGQELIQAMQDAYAHAQIYSARGTRHTPDPGAVRRQVRLTQAQMAPLMGMSLSGYRKWEQGQRAVSGPALNLLRVLEKNPAAVLEALA